MQRYMHWGVMGLVLILAAGCGDKKPPVPENPPPKIKTQGEIVGEFQPSLQPLQGAVASGTDVPRETGSAIAGALNSTKSKNAAEQNGAAAISQVTSDVEDLIKKANDKELWGTVVSACDALAALDPSNPKISRYKDRALLQLNRPKVKITSSIKIENDKTVFILDVYLPDKNKTETKKVSVGDEFLGLRFVDIVGNNEGIKLEYQATGDIFTVMRSK